MRLKFLDGLRGWGAVFVLLFHVFYDGLPVGPKIDWLHFFLPFNGGNAVLVFFLVSGFSLSIGYLMRGDIFSWIKIVSGRYFRLAIPVIGACAIVHVAMVTGILRPPGDRLAMYSGLLTFEPTVSHLVSFSLFDVFFRYNEGTTYIPPLWAIGPELQGSFSILALLPFLRPNGYRILFFIGFALLLTFVLDAVNWRAAEYIGIFPLGAAIAEAFRRGWLDRMTSYFSTALLAVGVASPLVLPPTFLTAMVAATALMVGAIATPSVRVFLENSFSTSLGAICFPLYLVHGPVMWIVGEPLMRNFGATMTNRVFIDLSIVGISFAAAYAFLPVNWLAVQVSHSIGDACAGVAVKLWPPVLGRVDRIA